MNDIKMNLKMFHNANKVAFLVQQYPDHTLEQIIALLAMPAIEINTAIWYATNEGWLEEPDKTTNKIGLGIPPDSWSFGESANTLKDHLLYAFLELAKKENDLTEEEVSGWCAGLPSHDLLVALKTLLNEESLATYQLTDPKDLESTYTFYTLCENVGKRWGKERFKVQPTGEEVPETPENAPEE